MYEGEHPVARPTRFLPAITATAGVAFTGAALLGSAGWLAAAFLAFALSGALRTPSGSRPPSTSRRVRTDADGIWIDGVLACPRRDVEALLVDPGGGGAARLRVPGRDDLVVYADEAAAAAMADALGVPTRPAARALRGARSERMARAYFLWLMSIAALVALGTRSGLDAYAGILFASYLVVLVGLAVAMWTTTRGEVGTDGLGISTFGRSELVPWSDVVSVEREGRLVVVRQRDGTRHVFSGGSTAEDAEMVEAIRTRIRATTDDVRPTEVEAALLGGAGARGVAGDAYRAGTLARDRLLALVESPAAPEGVREGAARVLVDQRLAPDEVERLRAVQAGTASRRIREVIATMTSPRVRVDDPGGARVRVDATADAEADEEEAPRSETEEPPRRMRR